MNFAVYDFTNYVQDSIEHSTGVAECFAIHTDLAAHRRDFVDFDIYMGR